MQRRGGEPGGAWRARRAAVRRYRRRPCTVASCARPKRLERGLDQQRRRRRGRAPGRARAIAPRVVGHRVEDGDARRQRRRPRRRTAGPRDRPAPAASSGRRVVHERERVGREVDADDAPVRGEPGAVAAGPASRVEDASLPVAQPRRQEVGRERARVAVPPVVVLDRRDARVLLDLHRRRGYRRSGGSALRRRGACR